MTNDENRGDVIRIPIRIDKDGTWYYQGAEMFRKDILALFFEALGYDGQNGYYVEMRGVRNYIDVDDTPFVVNSVTVEKPGQLIEDISIVLNDDSSESLDLASLRVGPGNVLYCCVKNGTFDARFSRPAYYQLARHVEHRVEGDEFFIATGHGRFRILRNVHERAGRG